MRPVPPLWLMTDPRVAEPDLLRAMAHMPRGSAVIMRHYELAEADRRTLFRRLRKAAQRRGLLILLAGDARQAHLWGADGHHGRTPAGRRKPGWLHSAPVHHHRELIAAQHAGADVLLVSPLFATRSHPGTQPLGPARFAALARAAQRPVIALGGVKLRHRVLLHRLGATGLAAIDGLTHKKL